MTLAKKRETDAPKHLETVKRLRMQEAEFHSDYVLMPWDDRREIIITEDGKTTTQTRWAIIQNQLDASRPIVTCIDLINVITSYNVIFEKNGKQTVPQWKCLVLQKYFASLDPSERNRFFEENGVLSTIRNLTLQLKELVPRLKLLRSSFSGTIKLHQMQIASLLANAFLCTFPKGIADCPSINFNMLYESYSNSVMSYNIEKIKCIINYFTRIHKKQPMGHLSFHRLCIPDHKFPRWDRTTTELSHLRVDSTEKIEDMDGYMQVDFANRYVGGGVLGRGCVQEEIRFVISPELIAARLFTESLADNEAMFVIGAERFCHYTGYSNTFKFAGDYEDRTPMDENGHRKSFLIIVDALCFNQFSEQFRESKILRELKKAYVGFKPIDNSDPLPLATGNWGCGAFGGDPQLKSLLQLMASSQARRNMLYLTFGDVGLKKQIDEMYKLLKENSVNVGKLYRIIRLYNREKKKSQTVFDFVKEALEKPDKSKSISQLHSSSTVPETSLISSLESSTKPSGDEDSNFPEMKMDFAALDECIENHCASTSGDLNVVSGGEKPGGMDTVWFENEVGKRNRQQVEEDEPRLSPSLLSGEEIVEIMDVSPEVEKAEEAFACEIVAESKNPSEAAMKYPEERDKLIHPAGGSASSQEKRLVQKKITDCFFRK